MSRGNISKTEIGYPYTSLLSSRRRGIPVAPYGLELPEDRGPHPAAVSCHYCKFYDRLVPHDGYFVCDMCLVDPNYRNWYKRQMDG